MFTTYKVWRDDSTNIKHHGKPTSKQYNICFMCAVKAIMNGDYVESKIMPIEYNCHDCSECE